MRGGRDNFFMAVALEARGLSQARGEKKCFSDVHLRVEAGECFGLLGPHGAGKSNLLKVLYGVSRDFKGELFLLGQNASQSFQDIKRRIGVVPQDDHLEAGFSVLENLVIFARYFGISSKEAKIRAQELLRIAHLDDEANASVDGLSLGARRRLMVVRGMLNQPQILFVDEPTRGVDPQSKKWIWQALLKFKMQKTTLLLATQDISDAGKICDRIAMMDKGLLLLEGVPEELIHHHIGQEVVEFRVSHTDVDYYVKKVRDKFNYQILNNKIRLFVGKGQEGRSALDLISSDTITVRKSSLDDVFLKVAGYELRRLEL